MNQYLIFYHFVCQDESQHHTLIPNLNFRVPTLTYMDEAQKIRFMFMPWKTSNAKRLVLWRKMPFPAILVNQPTLRRHIKMKINLLWSRWHTPEYMFFEMGLNGIDIKRWHISHTMQTLKHKAYLKKGLPWSTLTKQIIPIYKHMELYLINIKPTHPLLYKSRPQNKSFQIGVMQVWVHSTVFPLPKQGSGS